MHNGANYKFMQNKKCEYFPCHKGIKEEDFNCLFCFCPLYLVAECGGNPRWKSTDDGQVKDCSNCLRPHQPGAYENVLNAFKVLTARNRNRVYP